jgi:hypothetical protein
MLANGFTSRTAGLFRAGALVFALAGLPLVAGAADTASEVPRSYTELMKMKPMEVMHMMDVGKKGYVSRDEFMKFHGAMFDKMDRDRDGRLTQEEWITRLQTQP